MSLRCKVHVNTLNLIKNSENTTMNHMTIMTTHTHTVVYKLLVYKQVLKPVFTYGVQPSGCTKKGNQKKYSDISKQTTKEYC